MTQTTHHGPDVGAYPRSIREEKFATRVAEIAAFRDREGRLPSGRSADKTERILGRWLGSLRTTQRGMIGKGPQLDDRRIALLGNAIPGWDSVVPGNVPDDASFEDKLRKVQAFKAEHGRYPHSASPEADGLGTWLVRVRSASRGKGNIAWNRARAALVREYLPDWLSDGGQR